MEQVLLYRGLTDVLKEFREWTVPVFPVKGNTIRSVCEVTSKYQVTINQPAFNDWDGFFRR